MNKSQRRFLFFVIIFLAGIFLLSTSAFAEYPFLPWLDYTANFAYNDGTGGKAADKYKLTFNTWNITGGNYIGGSYFSEGSDPVTNAVISIGNLYNDSYSQNLIFGDTNNGGTGANGVTGPVSFTISNGSTTYLSATLNNFLVTDTAFSTDLNPLWDNTIANLTDITFNTSGSQYIQELQNSYNTYGYINLSTNFTFIQGTGGPGSGFAFTDDASGSIQGKMAVTPEPVSSILFVTGGATLVFRRHLKKRKKIES